MSRIKTLSRLVAIGFTLAGLLLTMTLHYRPVSAQAAQRLASARMLKPVTKANSSAQPNAAPLASLATRTVNRRFPQRADGNPIFSTSWIGAREVSSHA